MGIGVRASAGRAALAPARHASVPDTDSLTLSSHFTPSFALRWQGCCTAHSSFEPPVAGSGTCPSGGTPKFKPCHVAPPLVFSGPSKLVSLHPNNMVDGAVQPVLALGRPGIPRKRRPDRRRHTDELPTLPVGRRVSMRKAECNFDFIVCTT